MNKKTKTIAGLVVGALILSGGSFYAGTAYARANRAGGAAAFRNGAAAGGIGNRAGGAARSFGGAVTGEVVSLDSTSMTIKMRDGGSRIVFYGTSTPVMKSLAGSITDLVPGTQVSAAGEANADGSVNARTIQIRTGNEPFGGSGGAPQR